MSYEEIATVMQMGIDSVYNIISKALDALRESKGITLLIFCGTITFRSMVYFTCVSVALSTILQ
jgi:hypothetical protein